MQRQEQKMKKIIPVKSFISIIFYVESKNEQQLRFLLPVFS